MRLACTVALAVLATTCSSPNKPGPVVELAIHSVTPSAGPAAGGTEITIRGVAFAAGASVVIGGRAATDATVRGSDVITARTPASSASGVVDVAVTLNGRTSTLAGGFRYETIAPNTAPTIRSVTAQGTRANQPPLFADYGEIIRLSAVVEDLETPVAQLRYEWKPCGGTVTGSGPQVDWRVPAGGTVPPLCSIELIVIDGPHQAVTSVVVRLHDSIREVSVLAQDFLEEFANNSIPAATTVRNFSNSCSGKSDELADVTFVRNTRTIDSYTYGIATVTVAFGSMCRTKAADACVITPVEWHSTVKDTRALEIARGTSIISGVYRDSRWWLCDSLFQGNSSLGLRFVR